MSRQKILYFLVAVVGLLGFLTTSLSLQAQTQTAVFVNEIHYDNDGSDTGEAIEVAGPAGTDLTGWSLVLYNGNGGAAYDTETLSGVIPDLQSGFGAVAVFISGIQNGAPDGVALVDAGGSVVQFLSYEGSFTAVGGPADGLTSTDIGVAESSSTPVGDSLQLTGNGVVYEDFAWAATQPNTFGAVNTGQTFEGGTAVPAVSLNEIVVSTTSTDREFVELAGTAGDSLDGFAILEVASGGQIDTVLDLTGQTIPADGFWLAASPEAEAVLGVTADLAIVNNTFTNASQTYLLVYEFSGASGDDIDADDNGDIDNAVWTELVDSLAVIDDDAPVIYGDSIVGPDGTFLAPGGYRCPDAGGDWLLHDFSDIAAYTAGVANDCAAPVPVVNLNEIVVSTTGTDREFVELAGTAGDSLDGFAILEVASGGEIDTVLDLTGQTIPADGFWLAASPEAETVLGVTADLAIANNTFTNASQTYLLVTGFSGASGDDIDADDNGSIDNAVWTELVDSLAVIDDDTPITYGDSVVGPDGTFLAPGGYRCPDASGDWLLHDFSDIVAYTAGVANDCGSTTPAVTLNEIVVSTTSTDREFVELTGAAGESLDGYAILEVVSGGQIDTVLDLTGQTIPADGFWLAASPEAETVLGVTADLAIANNTFTNASQTYLLVTGFSGASGDDIDADDNGSIDNAVWAELVDSLAVIDDDSPIIYGSSVVGPDGTFLAPGGYRCPDASGDWLLHDFSDTAAYTAGVANDCDGGGAQEAKIHEVQGSGPDVAITGLVQVEAIVVADFQGGDELDGFFIQEEDSDADALPETSEGIFVFCGSCATDVNVGDAVQVVGVAEEFFGMSQLDATDSGGSVTILSSGNVLPAVTGITLPVATIDELEKYEGMYVTFPQSLVISEFFNFDRFGEIVLTTERQFQPTAVYDPGSPEAADLAAANALSRITLDDGRTIQNPDPAIHPNGAEFTLSNTFRGGDIVQNATGALNYAFGLYRLQPTQGADYTAVNARTDAPEDVGGDVTVASFNVLNYFTTFGSRGADNQEEFDRQRAKIIAALQAIDADVVGLIEIENNTEAIADLVSGLNDAMGAGTYDYVDTGVIGTDEIKVAFIYKPGTISLVGDYAVLDTPEFVNPNTPDPKNRPALAQTFQDNATGGVFTAVVNHLKSKGSPCGEGDDDPEAGSCNLTRTLAAQVLADWLATDPTGSGDPDFLILGDLNAYDKEDPIDTLIANGYSDLVGAFGGEFAYSYVFDGQLGYLDYAMANEALASQVTGTTVWYINADEPDIIDYDTTFKQDAQDALYEPNAYRSSDHDPVIVGLSLSEFVFNDDGCYVVALAGSPFAGPATVVEEDSGYYFSNRFFSFLWLRQNGESLQDACFELHGTDGRDIIYGWKYDDTLFGYGGRDNLSGLDGDDTFTGGDSRDLFRGGRGFDTVLDFEFRIDTPVSIESFVFPE